MNSIAQPVNIYQPTDAEISGVLSTNRITWPTLHSRIEKAEQILLSGGVALEQSAWKSAAVVHWKVVSQSQREYSYYVVVGRTLNCSCRDKGQRLGDLQFCKHNIAVSGYLRILRDHFNSDVCHGRIEVERTQVGYYLAFAQGLGIVTLDRQDNGYHFADHASAVKYAAWLAKQELSVYEAAFGAVEPELVASY